MEITTSHGQMNYKGCNCQWCRADRAATEDQHKKRIVKHIHRGIIDPAPILRWNKKRGKLELSKKGSRLLKWFY